MALTDIPFLSISAKGSIGNLTSRSSHRSYNLLQRPSPPVPLTTKRLAQFALLSRAILNARQGHTLWRTVYPYTLACNAQIWHFPSITHFLVSCYFAQNIPIPMYGMTLATGLGKIRWTFYNIQTSLFLLAPTSIVCHLKRPEDSYFVSLTPGVRVSIYLTFTPPTSHKGKTCSSYCSYKSKPISMLKSIFVP